MTPNSTAILRKSYPGRIVLLAALCLTYLAWGSYAPVMLGDFRDEFNVNSRTSVRIESMHEYNGIQLFFATSLDKRLELWRTDGTPTGSAPIHLIHDHSHLNLPTTQGRFFFAAETAAEKGLVYLSYNLESSRYELWRTNGTSEGTLRLQILPELRLTHEMRFWTCEGITFLAIKNTTEGQYLLWRTDGSPEKTWHFASVKEDSSYITSAYSVPDSEILSQATYFILPSNSTLATRGTAKSSHIIPFYIEGSGIIYAPFGNANQEKGTLFGVYGNINRFTNLKLVCWKNGSKKATHIKTLPAGSNPTTLVERVCVSCKYEGICYFSWNNGEATEWWRSDGTSKGTYRIHSVPWTTCDPILVPNPGPSHEPVYDPNCEKATCGSPMHITSFKGSIYLLCELAVYKYNPSSNSLSTLSQRPPAHLSPSLYSGDPSSTKELEGKLVFYWHDPVNSENCCYSTDGNTVTMHDEKLTKVYLGLHQYPNGYYYFINQEKRLQEISIFIPQTEEILSGITPYSDIDPWQYTTGAATLYPSANGFQFTHYQEGMSSGSWDYSLAENSLSLVHADSPLLNVNAFKAGDHMYFTKDGVRNAPDELWVCDTSGNNESFLKLLKSVGGIFFRENCIAINNTCYFLDGRKEKRFVEEESWDAYYDSEAQQWYVWEWIEELWRSNGTPESTQHIRDIKQNDGYPYKVGNNIVFVSAQNIQIYDTVAEIFTTTHTFETHYDGFSEFPKVILNNYLYLCLHKKDSHDDIWRMDCDTGSAELMYSFPDHINRIYSTESFLAFAVGEHRASADIELWLSDGSTAGTHLLSEGILNSILLPKDSPYRLSSTNELLYFVARTEEEQPYQIWRCDGTEDGTYPVTTFAPTNLDYEISYDEIGIYDNHFFFAPKDRPEIWVTDGTLEGTECIHRYGLWQAYKPATSLRNYSNTLILDDTLFYFVAGKLWRMDIDTDKDGIADVTAGTGDLDLDGIPNHLDDDMDGDGIPNSIEGNLDPDQDGIINALDTDSDGDGIPDAIEGSIDSDDGGVLNYLDLDSDGDGIPDAQEGGEDFDHDGIPNYLDTDSDGDGINDFSETLHDTDGDGVPDTLDNDIDGDGISNDTEGDADPDNDGIPNYLDPDSDNDGASDEDEWQLGGDPYDGVSNLPLSPWPLFIFFLFLVFILIPKKHFTD